MSNIPDRVRQFIRTHRLVRADTRVLAAVSGGSDSVALAHLLRELDAAGELRLTGLVHFNHQLRPTANDDERFVVELAGSLGRPIVTERADVAARARRERRSIEDTARSARYECFGRARAASSADVVALGHTRDDQAETVLLRLTRGAGPRGFAGMFPRNGSIIRPILECRRAELRAWLAGRERRFVDDETNQDVSIPRNRVRAELLPLLEKRFNPRIADVLADEADIAREVWRWLDTTAADTAARLVRPAADRGRTLVREIDVGELLAVPLAVRRAVLWRVMQELGGGRPIAFGHVGAALRLTEENAPGAPGAIDVPGQRLERIGGRLVLTGRSPATIGRAAAQEPSRFRYALSIPGEVALTEAGCLLSATEGATGASTPRGRAVLSNDVALVRRDLVQGSLAVRNRRPGDRFRPVGLKGRKKLQDYFVDRKVARGARDTVPIVVDDADRIVWVAGYEIDEAFRITDPAQAVLILKLKALGGSA